MLGGFLMAYPVFVTGGCSRDCENPRTIRTESNPVSGQYEEEPAVTCHMVLICEQKMQPDKRVAIPPYYVVDRGQDLQIRGRCRKALEGKILPECKEEELTFERECLDGKGTYGGPVSGPSGGTIVTVGVGASSGDFPKIESGGGGEGGASTGQGQGEEGDI